MNTLKVNETLELFQTQLKTNPEYIQQLVSKYFVDNKHKLVLTMLPKEEYGSDLEQAEEALLKEKLSNLTDEQINQIYLNGHILRTEQEKQENVEILPCLQMQDVNTIPLSGDCKQRKVSGVPVSVYKAGTNGVCYYRGVINTERMPRELKEVLPLFNSAVTQMGTKNYDYRTFSEMIALKTDGLDFSVHVSTDLSDFLKHEEGILIFSRCLNRNLHDMWNLWTELFNNVTLSDVQRFETIVKSNAASLVDGIADVGHSYAMLSAASLISPSYKLREMFSGLTYTKKMRNIAQQEDLSSTLSQMRDISNFVLNKTHLRSAMNCSSDEDYFFESVDKFYAAVSGSVVNPYIITQCQPIDDATKSVHHVLPFTVNYASKAILTVPYNDPDYAPLRIVAPLLSSVYLHPHIREKGGAYGGGASLSSNGVFFFYSYRDPNSTRTFDTFDGAYNFLRNYTLTDNDLHQAKIQVLRDYCAPIIPSGRGMEIFLAGLTDKMRMNVIKNVKATTKEDLMRVAEKYLQPEKSNLKVSRTLIGPENPELVQRTAEKWHVQIE